MTTVAGFLHSGTTFPTVAGALAALRCWVQAAVAGGFKPGDLCATLAITDASTTVMLDTRVSVALLSLGLRGGRQVRKAVLEHSLGETLVLVSRDGGPFNGDAIDNIDAVLAVTAARAAAQ